MSDDFRQKLVAFAARSVELAPRCANEESTKLFLILPFLHLLGYDDRTEEDRERMHARQTELLSTLAPGL